MSLIREGRRIFGFSYCAISLGFAGFDDVEVSFSKQKMGLENFVLFWTGSLGRVFASFFSWIAMITFILVPLVSTMSGGKERLVLCLQVIVIQKQEFSWKMKLL